jgi:hypothetical protein
VPLALLGLAPAALQTIKAPVVAAGRRRRRARGPERELGRRARRRLDDAASGQGLVDSGHRGQTGLPHRDGRRRGPRGRARRRPSNGAHREGDPGVLYVRVLQNDRPASGFRPDGRARVVRDVDRRAHRRGDRPRRGRSFRGAGALRDGRGLLQRAHRRDGWPALRPDCEEAPLRRGAALAAPPGQRVHTGTTGRPSSPRRLSVAVATPAA